jgi:hypothetical protein
MLLKWFCIPKVEMRAEKLGVSEARPSNPK